MSLQLSTQQLFDLYKLAVQEYRFEVKLNWDRTMYYIVFNTALIAAATGILKIDNQRAIDWLIAAIYLVGFVACLIGRNAIQKGHEYYRRTVIKKTLIEDLLGLTAPLKDYPLRHNLSIGTTTGQGEHWKHIHDTDNWLRRKNEWFRKSRACWTNFSISG